MIRTRLSSVLALLLLVTGLSGCAARQPTLDGFTIGFSTPSGNRIWIREAEFDGSWDVPGGNLACCWKQTVVMVGIGPGPMPSSVRVRWDDESRGIIYEARTELPEDLTEQARELPPITRDANGEVRKSHYLIIGLKDDGSMVVWLANYPHSKGIAGYALETIAEAEARVLRQLRPDERLKNEDGQL